MAVCKRVSLITLVLGVLTATMVGLAPTTPAAKAATWKCYRSAEENHHCYALAYWHMAGCTKECIQGGVADEVTESMDVPGWASGDFVDNEMWESSKASHGWVESGTTAGGGIDCCSLHRFEADVNNNGTGYSEYVQPGSIPLHEAHDYVIQDLEYNGIWRVYWGQENANWYEAGAYNHGYSSSTDELEAGFEGGANTQPTNSAAQALAVSGANHLRGTRGKGSIPTHNSQRVPQHVLNSGRAHGSATLSTTHHAEYKGKDRV